MLGSKYLAETQKVLTAHLYAAGGGGLKENKSWSIKTEGDGGGVITDAPGGVKDEVAAQNS